jgi:hypothetical protein
MRWPPRSASLVLREFMQQLVGVFLIAVSPFYFAHATNAAEFFD